MRSQASSFDGGLPEGTITVGRTPKVSAGERSAAGIGVIPATAAPEELFDEEGRVELAPVDVVADLAPVELDEQAAVARTNAVAPKRVQSPFCVGRRVIAARLPTAMSLKRDH